MTEQMSRHDTQCLVSCIHCFKLILKNVEPIGSVSVVLWLTCSPRVGQIVDTSHDRVKPKTISLVSIASPLSTPHQGEIAKTDWHESKIKCPIGTTCLSADGCFSELALLKQIELSVLIQYNADLIIIFFLKQDRYALMDFIRVIGKHHDNIKVEEQHFYCSSRFHKEMLIPC